MKIIIDFIEAFFHTVLHKKHPMRNMVFMSGQVPVWDRIWLGLCFLFIFLTIMSFPANLAAHAWLNLGLDFIFAYFLQLPTFYEFYCVKRYKKLPRFL